MCRFLSISFAALALLCGGLVPGAVQAQVRCGTMAHETPGPWLSAGVGMGVAVPLPTSSRMLVKAPALAFSQAVTLNLPPRWSVALHAVEKRFSESDSFYEWGRHVDLLVRGSVAAVMRRHLQWDISVLAGTSLVTIQAMDEDLAEAKVVNGQVQLVGPIRQSSITTVTAGLGTRLAVFPVDYVGIFAQTEVFYAYQAALEPDLGPLTVQITAGADVHF